MTERREAYGDDVEQGGRKTSNLEPSGLAAPSDVAHGERIGPLRRTIRVVNPSGLHHRVADRFTRTAKSYSSTVTVFHGDARADGKSLWDLILLVVLPNSEVVLEVEGSDAWVAVEPLAAILSASAGEDYSI